MHGSLDHLCNGGAESTNAEVVANCVADKGMMKEVESDDTLLACSCCKLCCGIGGTECHGSVQNVGSNSGRYGEEESPLWQQNYRRFDEKSAVIVRDG